MKYIKEYNDKWFSFRDSGSEAKSNFKLYIDKMCEIYGYTIGGYKINDDGSLDVQGGVYLRTKQLKRLPLRFRNVGGDFSCFENQLTNLDGAPQSVGGDFSCSCNRLTSLKGCPQTIGGSLYCHSNFIKDIYDIPKVRNDIYIMNNPVDSIVKYFIEREDKNEWIELFNELDIIQEYYVILDRLKYFYEGTKLNIDVTEKMLEKIKIAGYKIII